MQLFGNYNGEEMRLRFRKKVLAECLKRTAKGDKWNGVAIHIHNKVG